MEFISIKEAIKLFGKSDSYFRRLQREWTLTKPKSIKMIESKVHFDLTALNKKFDKVGINQRTSFDQVENEQRILAILERQLDEQNKQINHLNETIKAQTVMIHNLTESVKLIEQSNPKKRRWFW